MLTNDDFLSLSSELFDVVADFFFEGKLERGWGVALDTEFSPTTVFPRIGKKFARTASPRRRHFDVLEEPLLANDVRSHDRGEGVG